MAKRIAQPAQAAQDAAPTTLTIGLDIGYGAVKAAAEGRDAIIFPAVWGKARTIKFEDGFDPADYPGDQLTDDTGSWFIGQLAGKQLGAAETFQLRGRGANEIEGGNVDRARLAKAAIGKLLAGQRDGAVHIRLATGLPVDHMTGAADLKAALIGQHHIKTDNADFVANITEVMVMPQPYGTIYANTLTVKGEVNPCHTAIRTGVIDVGTYSTDLTVDDDGEYIDSESGSVEAGVYLAQQRLAQVIEEMTKQKPKPGLVDEVLQKKCLRVRGVVRDLTRDIEEAYDPVRRAALAKVNELWGAAAFIDTIYLSGGGATVIAQAVKTAGYEQAVTVDNPQTANARGYLNYAVWRAKSAE